MIKLVFRIFYNGKVVNKSFLFITSIYLATFYSHLTHLWSGRIDYGYNMQFNIAIGTYEKKLVSRNF